MYAATQFEKDIIIDGIKVTYVYIVEGDKQTLLSAFSEATDMTVGFKYATEYGVKYDVLSPSEFSVTGVPSNADFWGEFLTSREGILYSEFSMESLTALWGVDARDGFPGWDTILTHLRNSGVKEDKLTKLKAMAE